MDGWMNNRISGIKQGLHRLEKYLNLEGFLEKYWKIMQRPRKSLEFFYFL